MMVLVLAWSLCVWEMWLVYQSSPDLMMFIVAFLSKITVGFPLNIVGHISVTHLIQVIMETLIMDFPEPVVNFHWIVPTPIHPHYLTDSILLYLRPSGMSV